MHSISHYYSSARELSKLISLDSKTKSPNSHVIVTGGGPGIMEAAKEAINNVGFYDTSLNGIEDYDYILRTIEMNPNIGYVDEIVKLLVDHGADLNAKDELITYAEDVWNRNHISKQSLLYPEIIFGIFSTSNLLFPGSIRSGE